MENIFPRSEAVWLTGVSLLCFGLTGAILAPLVTFPGGESHVGQLVVTVAVLAAGVVAGAFVPVFWAGVVVVVEALGVFYLGLAAGPEVLAMTLAMTPSLWIAGTRFRLPWALVAGALQVAAASGAYFPHTIWNARWTSATWPQAASQALFVAVVFLLAVFFRRASLDAQARRRELERLDFGFQNIAKANLELQSYAIFAREQAVDQERRRVAGEIHDIIGYTLTNLIIQIQTALALSRGQPQIHSILEEAANQATDGLASARRSLALLRSREAPRPRGPNLYQQLVTRFSAATEVRVRLHLGNLPSHLAEPIEHALFRIVQEGLTNSFRHGKAESVDVGFWVDAGRVTVTVMDNGAAASEFHEAGQGGGIGLSGLTELAAGLGGRLTAAPTADGFVLRAEIPLGGTP